MEIWKDLESDIIEFDYQVSNLGNVRSTNYNRTGKTQNLKIRYSPTGSRCALFAGRKIRSIAQLVLNAFVEPRPSAKHFAHHKDGDLNNDAAENLEWRHIQVQNTINSRKGAEQGKGFRFPKGHSYGMKTRFKPKVVSNDLPIQA
ncbi:MAG: hypothetical protein RL329_656 [Bacteroidota bacterium]|jgi:hypothetical protein